jgi:hypothetical protein
MTRRKPPQPLAFAWRPGEPGTAARAVVRVPPELRGKYRAEVEFIEPEDGVAASPHLLRITDVDTGAVAEVYGDRMTLPLVGTPESIARLWAAARTIAGHPAKRGRPPGSPVSEERIWQAVRELVKAGREVKADSIAATSGLFTVEQLRYYFRVNHRSISDYR